MWDNIGSKLQKLAKVVCWLGIIVSVISGIVFMTQNQIVIGLVYLISKTQPTHRNAASRRFCYAGKGGDP